MSNTNPEKPPLSQRLLGKENPNRNLAEDAISTGWGSVVIFLFAVVVVAVVAIYFGRSIWFQTGSVIAAVAIPLLVAAVIGGLTFVYKVVLRD